MGHDNHHNPAKQIYNLCVGDDIKAALDAITDSSISKPYVVYLNAGVYSIGNNVLNVPAYVTLQALGGDTILDFTGNTTQEAITLSSGSKVIGVAIQNHLSSAYAFNINAAGSYVLDDITFLDVTRCVLVNHASARPTIRRPVFLPFGDAMTVGIKVEAGTPAIFDIRTGGNLALTDLIFVSGGHATLFSGFSEQASVVNGLHVSATGVLDANEVIVRNATKGCYIESGGELILRAGIMNENDYGCDITGTGSVFSGFNVSFLDNTVLNYQAGAGTISKGFGISDANYFSLHPDATMQAHFLSTAAEAESLAVLAELHVGHPTFPRKASLGAGASYVNGMLVYTYDDGLTTYTDRTTEAKSPAASTFTMGLDVNDALYVGSMVPISTSEFHKFLGIQFSSTVAAVLGSGDMVAEYPTAQTGSITAFADAGGGQVTVTSAAHGLSNGDVVTISGTTNYNGTFEITNVTTNTFEITDTWVANDATGTWGDVWSRFNIMTVQASGKYYRKNSALFTVATGTYDVMFNPAIRADWTKTDPMTLGTSYYWVRFRIITATITTAPTFEQIRLQTDNVKINVDGFRQMSGNARAYAGIPVFWNSFQDAGANMGDQDLWRSSNCKAGMINNNFNTDDDNVGAVFPLARWIDTSAPLVVEVVLVPSGTGTLQMIAWLNSSKDGDTISTTDPASTAGETSHTVSKSGVAGQQVTYQFTLDISHKGAEADGDPAELLWLNIEAASRGTAGNTYGVSFLVKALQFRDGEHL